MSLLKLTTARFSILSIRHYSLTHRSSHHIRQQFLDFFIKDNNHQFVKSSSVIPFCDPTLSFCNAGMNQFKNILLGNQTAKHKRVANSQKCIRVGGKHNDLSIVGSDSYHHTFFEMLGNWSFGDYFKKEACEMAWTLLTKVYKIPPERLYVTYFKGDEKLGLASDLECREIWRQIGMPRNRIIGFGTRENFWEMGASGPCGGCSEIHVDHSPSFASFNRAADVNQDKSDLTELWNIVFIEHFRHADGSVTKLPERHIDTGMGFERLVSFLQGKTSNYDSDLFKPIFEKIQNATGAPVYSGEFDGDNCRKDTAYRVLADHSRMVAVSLADGMFPEQNQKLRRVLRKCINISERDFNKPNLLTHTIPIVSEILGETFTELTHRLPQVLDIVKYEQELYKSLRSTMSRDISRIVKKNPKLSEIEMFDYPAFVEGYDELISCKKSGNALSGDQMYYIHSSFGFDLELLERLAELEGMKTDKAAFESKMRQVKMAFNNQHLNTEIIDSLLDSSTDNELKYQYTFDGVRQIYKVDTVKSKILSIVNQTGSVANSSSASGSVKLILDRSPFYYESGGQESDAGFICKNGQKFQLKSLSNRRNCVLHEIELCPTDALQVGDEVELEVDQEKRSAVTRNHSATHLLNSAIREVTNAPIYQKSSLVTSDNLKIELACFGPKLGHKMLKKFEELIRFHIKQRPLERKIRILNSQDLQNESGVVMVPGETYPDDGIRLVTFGDFSRELCCGTHVFNTQELLEFTFLSMRGTGRSSYLFTATTGPTATAAVSLGIELVAQLKTINENVKADSLDKTESELREISIKLNNSNTPVSFLKKLECQDLTSEIKLKIKKANGKILSEILEREMKSLPDSPFIVHNLACSEKMENIELRKATRHIKDRPVLVMSHTDGLVKAQCCVPENLATNKFNAEMWLGKVSKVFNSEVLASKGKSLKELCNMRDTRVNSGQFEKMRQEATEVANDFARGNLK